MAERVAEELWALEAEHPDRFGLLKLEFRALIFDSGCCCSPSVPSTGPSWVVERAVEELRALEMEHPNRHGRLKLELRVFISDALRSHPSLLPTEGSLPPCPCFPSTCSAATQESSNRKRRIKEAKNHMVATANATGQKLGEETRPKAAKDSADMALERAERCLRKIRRVKEMLAHGF